jgi:hypothetical protein
VAYFSLKSAVKPMPRRFGSGGRLISSRIALRIPTYRDFRKIYR